LQRHGKHSSQQLKVDSDLELEEGEVPVSKAGQNEIGKMTEESMPLHDNNTSVMTYGTCSTFAATLECHAALNETPMVLTSRTC
jgi:hypothetical protein